MSPLSTTEFAPRLVAGRGRGALIGIERQWRTRMARLRTNALVAAGATLFVLYPVAVGGTDGPIRVAPHLVSGIGFLGAEVILSDGAVSTRAALAAGPRLPHYGHATALIGTSILPAILIVVAIAVLRSRRK